MLEVQELITNRKNGNHKKNVEIAKEFIINNLTKSIPFEILDECYLSFYEMKDYDTAKKIANKIYVDVLEGKFSKSYKQHSERIRYNISFLPKDETKKKIAILGFKSDSFGEWDPMKKDEGIPGSEEAIIYAGEELAKKGYEVTIFANPPKDSPWSLDVSNPQYLSVDDLDSDSKYDYILFWRRTDFLFGKGKANKLIFWPHDLSRGKINEKDLKCLDGVFFLSEFHRNNYIKDTPDIKDIPYVISGNGLDPKQFENNVIKENPYSCVYISNYARGLDVLLDIWPEIKEKYPKAQLDIYYGREVWNSISQDKLLEIIKKITKLSKKGVVEHGKVGHGKLAEALMKRSILTYPNNLSCETYCISAVKAQAAGCIPITTRLDALKETVHPDAPTVDNVSTPENIEAYKNLVLDTMKRIKENGDEVEIERNKYRTFGLERTWGNCVSKWISLFDQLSLEDKKRIEKEKEEKEKKEKAEQEEKERKEILKKRKEMRDEQSEDKSEELEKVPEKESEKESDTKVKEVPKKKKNGKKK